jgi:hypothetical protein
MAPGTVGARGATGVAGDAATEATVEYAGLDAVRAAASSTGGATPDNAPDQGGNASSTASATTAGSGAVTATALAQGGRAISGAYVGDATAAAYGSNAGSGDVGVFAEALSGIVKCTIGGGYCGSPSSREVGSVDAQAEGHSTGGGDVTARAVALAGISQLAVHDVELRNAVSGSTSGRLRLEQVAGALSGSTRTDLQATNPGGGDLEVHVEARSGYGDQGAGSDTVLGDILATSNTGAGVSIEVEADGGLSHSGMDAGTVLQRKLDPGLEDQRSVIHGASNVGAVLVAAVFRGGSPPFGGTNGGSGGSVAMDNAVSGETSGDLELYQQASGGLAGSGNGGSAYSRLDHEAAATSFLLTSWAEGGGGSSTGGGNARSEVEGINSAGPVEVRYLALGGGGGFASGGDAIAEAYGRTTGDGQPVVVGGSRTVSLYYGAQGGSAVVARIPVTPAPPPILTLGDGGDAVSRATGIAEGDSVVTVVDSATGGMGGALWSIGSPRPDTVGGDGGDATSSATASGAGTSKVSATSIARGGPGGTQVETPGDGGDARALATADGLGEVEAVATATGGGVDLGGAPGWAAAHAGASGASGLARADATSGWIGDGWIRAVAEAAVGSSRSVEAAAGFGSAPVESVSAAGLDEPDGQALILGDPGSEATEAALAGNAELAALYAADPSAAMTGVAAFGGAGAGGHPLVLTSHFDVTLSDAEADRRLVVGAFDFAVVGDGFDALGFRIEKFGTPFGEAQTFDSLEQALAFFEAAVFDVGMGLGGSPSFDAPQLRLIFDLTVAEGDAFGMQVALMTLVPEPSTGLLVGLGLLVLGVRRRARA